jgi:hypothetical protein
VLRGRVGRSGTISVKGQTVPRLPMAPGRRFGVILLRFAKGLR